jgi:hypothetical protein
MKMISRKKLMRWIFFYMIVIVFHKKICSMSFLTKLWEFWHNAHTYAIRYAESGDVWKNCKPPHIIKSKWERYLKLFTLDTFKRMSHNGSLNRNKEAHSSIIKHIKGSLFFINHAKHLVRAYLFLSFFLQMVVIICEKV